MGRSRWDDEANLYKRRRGRQIVDAWSAQNDWADDEAMWHDKMKRNRFVSIAFKWKPTFPGAESMTPGTIIWCRQEALVFGRNRQPPKPFRPCLLLRAGECYVLPLTTKPPANDPNKFNLLTVAENAIFWVPPDPREREGAWLEQELVTEQDLKLPILAKILDVGLLGALGRLAMKLKDQNASN